MFCQWAYRDFVHVLAICSEQVLADRRMNSGGLAFASEATVRQNRRIMPLADLVYLFHRINQKFWKNCDNPFKLFKKSVNLGASRTRRPVESPCTGQDGKFASRRLRTIGVLRESLRQNLLKGVERSDRDLIEALKGPGVQLKWFRNWNVFERTWGKWR